MCKYYIINEFAVFEEVLSIVAPQSCPNGYNYNVELGYDVAFSGSNIPANLWTLQGNILNCGDAATIFFDLPNQGGGGTLTTTTNPWRSQSDCATATLADFGCQALEITIDGPGIASQTLSLTPSSSNNGNGNNQDWCMEGNLSDTTKFLGTTNNSPLIMRTNNEERLRISEDGKVGIGIANPTDLLTVNGDARVNGTLTTGGLNVLQNIQADTITGAIRVNVNGNLTLGEEAGYNGITSRYEELLINSRPGFDHNVVMNANTNGNLGVGVINPQEKFDLFGNARLTGDVIFSSYASTTDTTERFIMVNKDGQTQPKNFGNIIGEMYSDKYVDCGANGYKPTWINDYGKIYTAHLTGNNCQANVGIGTDDPQSKLHVNGTTRTTRLHAGVFQQANAGLAMSVYQLGTSNSASSIVKFGRHHNNESFTYFDLRRDGTLRLQNENREIFIVNMDDETVHARRIVVDQDTWPDYVFKKSYKLRTLDEVKDHIDEYGYLPNVPSESEVLENGIDLAEMNKILLEKIEELTLYTLEQQKELNDLKEKLNQLLEE